MYNPFSLEGKTILITGASSGIGQTTAIECSKMGGTVIITARNKERLMHTFDQMEGSGHQMILADLTNEDNIEELAEKCPKIDGLVNNAGVASNKPVAFFSQKELDKVYSANTYAPMLTIRWLLRQKKLNNNGSIVFTASVASICSTLSNGIYGSSKAAIAAYMKYCARELSSKGIRANAVHPGMVETKLIHGGAYSEEDLSNELKNYPLGRYGKPEEIAYAIIYLLSDAATWTTGDSLFVDGGCTLQ